MTNQTVQSKVKQIRSAKKMTQSDVAQFIGVSRQTVVAIEGGNYTPSVLLALKLAHLLETTVEELFTIED